MQANPEKLHAKFLDWLERLAPKSDSMTTIKETIRTVWKQRQGDADQLRSVLKRKLTEVETRKTTLVDRWLDGKVDQKTFDEINTRLIAEIEKVLGELRGTELESFELERVLEFAERIICDQRGSGLSPHLISVSAFRRHCSLTGYFLTGRNLEPTQLPYFSVL